MGRITRAPWITLRSCEGDSPTSPARPIRATAAGKMARNQWKARLAALVVIRSSRRPEQGVPDDSRFHAAKLPHPDPAGCRSGSGQLPVPVAGNRALGRLLVRRVGLAGRLGQSCRWVGLPCRLGAGHGCAAGIGLGGTCAGRWWRSGRRPVAPARSRGPADQDRLSPSRCGCGACRCGPAGRARPRGPGGWPGPPSSNPLADAAM